MVLYTDRTFFRTFTHSLLLFRFRWTITYVSRREPCAELFNCNCCFTATAFCQPIILGLNVFIYTIVLKRVTCRIRTNVNKCHKLVPKPLGQRHHVNISTPTGNRTQVTGLKVRGFTTKLWVQKKRSWRDSNSQPRTVTGWYSNQLNYKTIVFVVPGRLELPTPILSGW